jgi:hypothetical protein
MAEGHGLYVEFSMEPVKRDFKSEEAGRDIYEDVEWVRITVPGLRANTIEREVNDQDKKRFALEYAAFKNGLKEQAQTPGTPVIMWPAMSRAMAKMLASFNIYSVEQCANLSDSAIQEIGMGAREWKTKAIAFLELAKDTGAAQKYAVENEDLKREMAELRGQLAELSNRLTEPEKRGPGRPRKPENAIHEITEAL